MPDKALLTLLSRILQKRGMAISGGNMQHLQTAHDSLQKATGGAVCKGDMMQKPGIQMAAGLAGEDLAKALAPAFDGLAKVLEQNGIQIKALADRVDHLEKQPAAGAPAQRAVPVEKVLPGQALTPAEKPAEDAELEMLRKQQTVATDPAIQKWLADQITRIELKKVFTGR
jgi:hypothetical protein